jgi:hypothetical protein
VTASGSSVSTPAVEVKSLTKSFGGRLALKGVDLVVGEGEFLSISVRQRNLRREIESLREEIRNKRQS